MLRWALGDTCSNTHPTYLLALHSEDDNRPRGIGCVLEEGTIRENVKLITGQRWVPCRELSPHAQNLGIDWPVVGGVSGEDSHLMLGQTVLEDVLIDTPGNSGLWYRDKSPEG